MILVTTAIVNGCGCDQTPYAAMHSQGVVDLKRTRGLHTLFNSRDVDVQSLNM